MRVLVAVSLSSILGLSFSDHTKDLIESSYPVGNDTIECFACDFVFNATNGDPFMGDQRCRDDLANLPNNTQTYPAKIKTPSGFEANVVCATFNNTFHESIEYRENESHVKEVIHLGIYERATFVQYVGSTLDGYEGILKYHEHEYSCGRNTSTCSEKYEQRPHAKFVDKQYEKN